jgi:uncharacterized protein (TIGR02453 family)
MLNKKVTDTKFTGFPAETFQYLEDLSLHNNRDWWHENKERYERAYLAPAYAFVNAMGEALSAIVKGLTYEARVNKSIFRINKDIRFSKDKSPYKTHLGMVFWKGPHDSRDLNPGFYVHLEAHRIYLACGTWMPAADVLAEYRNSLQDKKLGSVLKKEVEALEKQGIFLNREYMLKKTAPKFPANHALAEYSKFKTLFVEMEEIGIPDITHTAEFVDYCMAFFSKPIRLFDWLVELTNRAYKG